jgi:hypothetical protein
MARKRGPKTPYRGTQSQIPKGDLISIYQHIYRESIRDPTPGRPLYIGAYPMARLRDPEQTVNKP